jgi:ATP-dependent Clp protease adapter protein ClpS
MSLLQRMVDRLFGVTRVPPGDNPVIFPPETSLLAQPKFVPAGFQHGVEILNDNTTPMEFVVNMLTGHIGLSHQEATRLMLSIHFRGGILLPLPSMADAEKAARAISAEARQNHHALICRAVSAR